MKPFKRYEVAQPVFDAWNKDLPVQAALGTKRSAEVLEAAEIHSTNWVPDVSGWRLTRRGLELGASTGVFPPGTVTFTDIQDIATDKILGRDTAGTGDIEQLGLGAGLSISGGNLVNTVSAYTTEEAQDAVGAMVDASLTYTDGTPLLGVTSTFRRKSLFDHFADVSVGGAEADIYTATTAASQLANNGEKLVTQYGGNFVTGGTELTQLKVYFAGTAIWDSTGLAPATGTTSWRVLTEIIRVSSTVVRYTVSMNTTGATGYTYCTVGELTGLTLSNTNIIKITGTSSGVGSGAGDIVGKMGSVEWLAAA